MLAPPSAAARLTAMAQATAPSIDRVPLRLLKSDLVALTVRLDLRVGEAPPEDRGARHCFRRPATTAVSKIADCRHHHRGHLPEVDARQALFQQDRLHLRAMCGSKAISWTLCVLQSSRILSATAL